MSVECKRFESEQSFSKERKRFDSLSKVCQGTQHFLKSEHKASKTNTKVSKVNKVSRVKANAQSVKEYN